MSLPHVCECRICGTTFSPGSLLGVPAIPIPHWLDIGGLAPDLTGGLPVVPAGTIAVCTHGYTVCKPCKFPPPPVAPPDLGMRGAWAPDRAEVPPV